MGINVSRLSPTEYLTYQNLQSSEINNIWERKAKKAVIKSSLTALGRFVDHLLEKAAPYIVLIIIILLLVVLAANPYFFSPSRPINTVSSWVYSIWSWIWSFFPFPDAGYAIRRAFGMFSPYQSNGESIPREKMTSGRCSQLRWLQDTEDGTAGKCISAIAPEDITWEFDPNKLADYDYLPDTRKSEFENRMRIRIPYTPEASFFNPRCDLAYYVDKDNKPITITDKNGNPITPANTIFEDTGTSCKLAIRSNQLYYPTPVPK